MTYFPSVSESNFPCRFSTLLGFNVFGAVGSDRCTDLNSSNHCLHTTIDHVVRIMFCFPDELVLVCFILF